MTTDLSAALRYSAGRFARYAYILLAHHFIYTVCPPQTSILYFLILGQKSADLSYFWHTESWRNFWGWFVPVHHVWKMLPLYLRKCRYHARDRSCVASLKKVDVSEIASHLTTQISDKQYCRNCLECPTCVDIWVISSYFHHQSIALSDFWPNYS